MLSHFPFYITALSDRASEADQGWVMALSSAMVGLAWTLSGYLTSLFVNIDLILPTAIAAIGYLIAGWYRRSHAKSSNSYCCCLLISLTMKLLMTPLARTLAAHCFQPCYPTSAPIWHGINRRSFTKQ